MVAAMSENWIEVGTMNDIPQLGSRVVETSKGNIAIFRTAEDEIFALRDKCPQIDFYQMGTGFTWNTQDKSGDIEAAKKTWEVAAPMLADESYDLVVLDELTYMIGYKYLDEAMVLKALSSRPESQSVVVTGRGGGSALQDIMDTVSEVKDIKHAYKAGIKARKGVDY